MQDRRSFLCYRQHRWINDRASVLGFVLLGVMSKAVVLLVIRVRSAVTDAVRL